jgi:hypothetical protein
LTIAHSQQRLGGLLGGAALPQVLQQLVLFLTKQGANRALERGGSHGQNVSFFES